MSGGMLIFAGKLLIKSIDFVALLFLARILSQTDFGLIGLAMTFVVVAEAVLDIPLHQILLKERNISPAMLDTVFTLSILRGLLIAILLCGIAYPIGLAYGDARLTPLICVLAIAPAFRGARSPALVFFLREMDFRWEMLVELLGKLIAGITCICLAYQTGSYWALVTGVVLTPITTNLMSYVIAPYSPHLSLAQWHRFSNFTGWTTVSQIARATSWQVDKIMLGSFLSTGLFGKYSVAKDLSNTSQQALLPPILKPLMSACSEAVHRDKDLGQFYLKTCNAILLVVGPAFLILGVLADQVVLIALGDQWSETGWILRWFSFMAVLGAVLRPVESLALVLNQNRAFALVMLLTTAIRVPLIWIGCMMYSYQGAVIALAISEVISFVVMSSVGCKLTNVSLLCQWNALRSTTFALLVMGICLFLLAPENYIVEENKIFFAIRCVVAVVAALCVYGIAVYSLWWIEGTPDGLQRSLLAKLSKLLRLTRGEVKLS